MTNEMRRQVYELTKKAVEEMTNIKVTDDVMLHHVLSDMKNIDLSTTNFIIGNEHPHIPQNSRLFANLIFRIGLDLLHVTGFKSNFSRFIQKIDNGNYVMESIINLKEPLDRNELSNSDLFTMYVDQIESSIHGIDYEKILIADYRKQDIQKATQTWEHLADIISGIITNLNTSFENWVEENSYQILFDFYNLGAMSCVEVVNPRNSDENSADYIANVLKKIDDFRGKPSPRDIMFNNSNEVISEAVAPLLSNTQNVPLLITFQDTQRYSEVLNALNLYFGKSYDSGNGNQDFMQNLMIINRDDFYYVNGNKNKPREVSPKAREMLSKYYSGTPLINGNLEGFLVDPDIFMYYSQFMFMLDFTNVVTLNVKQTYHNDLIMNLSPFKKACAFVSLDNNESTTLNSNIETVENLTNMVNDLMEQIKNMSNKNESNSEKVGGDNKINEESIKNINSRSISNKNKETNTSKNK